MSRELEEFLEYSEDTDSRWFRTPTLDERHLHVGSSGVGVDAKFNTSQACQHVAVTTSLRPNLTRRVFGNHFLNPIKSNPKPNLGSPNFWRPLRFLSAQATQANPTPLKRLSKKLGWPSKSVPASFDSEGTPCKLSLTCRVGVCNRLLERARLFGLRRIFASRRQFLARFI